MLAQIHVICNYHFLNFEVATFIDQNKFEWQRFNIKITLFLALLGYDNDEALGTKMLHLSRQINTLRQRVEDENLERRSIICKRPDNCLADFPHLDETELRNITFIPDAHGWMPMASLKVSHFYANSVDQCPMLRLW
jgi:hypothetical protein